MSIFSVITQPYRYSVQIDATVRTTYELARQVEIESALTNLADADAVALELFNILKFPRQRFDVPVIGVDVVNLSMYDGLPPCATLTDSRFGLQAGKLIVIPDFTIDLSVGQTVLRCWG
jgi:hypothetical protein